MSDPKLLETDRGLEVSLWTGTLLWLSLAAVWVTWTPIQLSERPNLPLLVPRSSPHELLANFLLLAPIGFVVALRPWRQRMLTAAVCGALISTLIEIGQIFLAGRIVSVTDVVLNTAGAAAGAAAAIWISRRTSASRALAGVGTLVFAALLAFAINGARIFDQALRMDNWDPSFPISMGDENGGGKKYLGRILEARICSVAVGEAVCATGGASAAERRRLVDAAQQSQQVDIQARLVPATIEQWGPTRIITFSDGWFSRNVTLGQEGSALVLRIRTPLMGPNGQQYEVWIPRAFTPGVPLDISASFQDGLVTTDLITPAGRRTVTHRFDAFTSGLLLRGHGAVTPLQVRVTRALGATILFMPCALLALGVLPTIIARAQQRSGRTRGADAGQMEC